MSEVRNRKRGIKKSRIWVIVAAERFPGGSACQITAPKEAKKIKGRRNLLRAYIGVNLLYNRRVFTAIAYFPIFLGRPLIMYLGILTLLSLLFTAYAGYANFRGLRYAPPFSWHLKLAITTVALAIIHGSLGLLSQFGL